LDLQVSDLIPDNCARYPVPTNPGVPDTGEAMAISVISDKDAC